MPSASEHVQRELGTLSCRKYLSGSDFRIQCPYHEGDANPSLGVNVSLASGVPVGTFHCFGCGESGGWNKLAAKLGLERIANAGGLEEHTDGYVEYQEAMEGRLLGGHGDPMPRNGISFQGDAWRGVSGDTVRLAGGKSAMDWKEKEVCLWLPVLDGGKACMAVQCRMEPARNKPSYRMHDPNRIKNKPWYGYDMAASMLEQGSPRAVFLVEGARDALRLVDEGLPALALLGTRQWNRRKRDMLSALCSEHSARPVAMMDSDEAGAKAQKEIRRDLSGRIDGVLEVRLDVLARKEGMRSMDPADMPKRIVKAVKKAACGIGGKPCRKRRP